MALVARTTVPMLELSSLMVLFPVELEVVGKKELIFPIKLDILELERLRICVELNCQL